MTDLPTRPFLALALSALLASGSALAQQAETGAAEDAPAAEAAEGGADDLAAQVLSTGEEVATPGQGPSIYIREEHGDWEIRCLENPGDGPDPCQMFQRLSDQNGNPTADVNVFDLPDGGEIVAGATILTPLQTLLTAQVTMRIDNGPARRYPFSFCDTSGCYARLGLTADDVNRMRRGAAATVIVVPAQAPDQQAELTMSLTGFTAGYEAVTVANPE
ncbi:invasion associated locus B family protein [Jannaschia seohaensis]|uniref:Invasion protein IalB n=1 Tax=Jannaschia seohaensis TaxID=475081 RepID=A0A2Y9AQ40_9RHOB|nr:invasion associated locus B family protein [Jannaschia seohaensis]PWJ20385.1 invasion protein IalB [Jannaschia seohaensis]SSA44449.1 Invasion protein IalB, involved in pathogenesis [Jannaschia seohaensis]